LGNAAAGAAKTDTFPGEEYRRIARRRGSKRAIVALGRSILVIAWHLLSDPDARFCDLGPGYYATRIDPEHRKQNHIHSSLRPSATPSPSSPPPEPPTPSPVGLRQCFHR
jgi:transposase